MNRGSLTVLLLVLLSACGYWPEELEALASALTEQMSAETTAWRVGRDVVVIDVAGAPLFRASDSEAESAATEMAAQAIAYVEVPLSGVSITFHEREVSDEADRLREYVFLVQDGRPVLQPSLDFSATGPLTLEEIEANFLSLREQPLSEAREACLLREVEARAQAAGDPETLDPAAVELLPADSWQLLDAAGRRLILMQAITTKASFVCISSAGAPGSDAAHPATPAASRLITADDPRFALFELSNSEGPGSFASDHGTILLSFLADDGRYCRNAALTSPPAAVLACRVEDGWEIVASGRLAPVESTTTRVLGGGDMSAVSNAIRTLNPAEELLDERQVVEAARRGWH